jgi:predicted RNase H-like HicB family nuclease
MPGTRIKVGVEITPKKAFASALDWPGWTRAGKDPEAALAALAAAAERYAPVARKAGLEVPPNPEPTFDVVEEAPGNATTAFGAPDVRFEADHRRVTGREAARLASIVEAAWKVFDGVAAKAPAELRKGPRGGGRDRDKIVAHVLGADGGYARSIGIKHPEVDPGDTRARDALRRAVLEVLRQPSDGSPIAGRKWPPRYAARRIAWHALDHAWEIEDRSEPSA